jgi:hypothetical protein
MSSQSSLPAADQAPITITHTHRLPSAAARSRAAAKGVATAQRHRQEQRVERLALIDAQIADGTLVVRQMPVAQRKANPVA